MEDAADTSSALVPVAPAALAAGEVVAEQEATEASVVELDTTGAASTRPGPRRALFLAAIGGSVLAIAYALAPSPGGDDLELHASRAARPAAFATAKPKPIDLFAPARDPLPVQPAGDPFVPVSFVPPPPPAPPAPPPAPPAPPPVPHAPPLPFAFVGLLEKGGPKPAAFLSRGDALLVVSAGDIVDKEYRIESLSAREIVVTYLPLNERQSLIATGARQ